MSLTTNFVLVMFKLLGKHLTDVTNASRTFLFDIDMLHWDEQLCKFFNVPMDILPEIKPSGDMFGTILEGPLKGVSVTAVSTQFSLIFELANRIHVIGYW